MSSKYRRGLPKKRPDTPAKDEIAEDLPELEPIDDDLPTLEPLEAGALAGTDDAGGAVRVDTKALEPGFHVTLTVDVDAMEKDRVADAITAPLRRAATAQEIRHKRVLVRFTGDAIVGSAAKARVAELMKEQMPLLAVVRRGYGDETVFEGRLPAVDVAVDTQGDLVRVEVETGATESRDLSTALAQHLPRIASSARGKSVEVTFRGAAPVQETCDQIASALHDVGALRATVDGRLLFDRELTDRIQVEVAGGTAVIRVDPADDDATTAWALASVVPEYATALADKTVTLRGTKPLSPAVVEACIAACREARAANVGLVDGDVTVVVWPPLLAREQGAETTLRVTTGGRNRAEMLSAFRREAALMAGATEGRDVVVDWPAGTALDDELESFCRDELGTLLRPKSLACTVAGMQREPMLPDPASLSVDGDRLTLRLDSEAGKPLELQRAVDRRLASLGDRLRGKSVRIAIAGSAAVSRTLLRSLQERIEAAGAARLELDDHGSVDVLVPPLLSIATSGSEVRLAAAAEGRDDAQLTRALQRELDAAAPLSGATVLVAPSPAAEAIAAVAVARGAAKVVLDGPDPVVVHPKLFGAPEKTGLSRRLPVRPAGDAAMVERQVERELPELLAGLGPVMTATITVAWPGAEATAPAVVKLVQGLVGKKAAKVLLDSGDGGKPLQMHPPLPGAAPIVPPPLPAAPAKSAPALVPPAAPEAASPAEPAMAAAAAASDDMPVLPLADEAEPTEPTEPAAPAGPLVTVLGQKSAATPPLVMLGVEAGTGAAHIARVEAELAELRSRLEGAAVLFVLRRGGADVPALREGALVSALRRHCVGLAAATLVFRGSDAAGRPFFQVADSTVVTLAVGAAIADPRPR